MNSMLRVLNVLSIAILVAFGFQSSALEGQEAAYRAGWWAGMAIFVIAPTLALFALGSSASSRLRRNAMRVNVAQIVAFVALGILPRLHDPMLFPATVGVLLFSIPSALNVWRLRAMNRGDFESESDPEDSSWYLVRHWRGALPLGHSFWVNGALAAMYLLVCFGVFGVFAERMPLRTGARGTLALFAGVLLCGLWLGVGIWRSATRRAGDGARVWPAIAKVSVVLATLGYGLLVAKLTWPQLKENALIAVGRDPLEPIGAKVTTNETVLLLHGTFGEGSADKVRRLLAATPTIRTIALASNGGRLREAHDIALLTKGRRLDTYVDTRCESACTYVFLAGRDRAATPNARIGFHRPSFAGMNPLTQITATNSMLRTYREAGIPQAFLDRVAATEASSMWYPSRAELIDAGVINRVSLGGETAAISAIALGSKKEMKLAFRSVPMMAALERHFPGTLDQAVQAAWNERTQGAIDADVSSAARAVVSDRYPKILAAANDKGLDVFSHLMLDEMKAALAISTEACARLLQGQLNIAQVLSPELAQRELDWAMGILQAERLEPRARVAPAEFQQASLVATASMSQELLDVVREPEKYRGQPKLQCSATIDFYERVLAMPDESRHVLLRGMFEQASN